MHKPYIQPASLISYSAEAVGSASPTSELKCLFSQVPKSATLSITIKATGWQEQLAEPAKRACFKTKKEKEWKRRKKERELRS